MFKKHQNKCKIFIQGNMYEKYRNVQKTYNVAIFNKGASKIVEEENKHKNKTQKSHPSVKQETFQRAEEK